MRWLDEPSSHGVTGGCWHPERALHVEAAGARDLALTLMLAFGPARIDGYRIDREEVRGAGDALWLFSPGGESSMENDFATSAPPHATRVLRKAGSLSYLPTKMTIEGIVPLVLEFIADGAYPQDPDCDGSIMKGGFIARLAPLHDAVRIELAWRAFHK